MKKYLCAVLCIALAVILFTGLTGCNDSPKYEAFVLYEANDAGEKFTAAEIQKELDDQGSDAKIEDMFYLHMYEDGTAVLCSLGVSEKMQYNDTEIWSINDASVRATYTRAGDIITLFADSLVLTYKKG